MSMLWLKSSLRRIALYNFALSLSGLAEPIAFFEHGVAEVSFGGDYLLQVLDLDFEGFAQVIVGSDDGVHR